MNKNKSLLRETSEDVNEILKTHDLCKTQRLQYMVIAASLASMISIVSLLHNIRKIKKSR